MNLDKAAKQASIPDHIVGLYRNELTNLLYDAHKPIPKPFVQLLDDLEYTMQQTTGLSGEQAVLFRQLKKRIAECRKEKALWDSLNGS